MEYVFIDVDSLNDLQMILVLYFEFFSVLELGDEVFLDDGKFCLIVVEGKFGFVMVCVDVFGILKN